MKCYPRGAARTPRTVDEAIGAANITRTAGRHVFVPAFGEIVGNAGYILNVQKISGPDNLDTPTSFLLADYVISPSPAVLAAAIQELSPDCVHRL